MGSMVVVVEKAGKGAAAEMRILPRYIRNRFIRLFLFCLLSSILLFLIVDLVEDLDNFIDKQVSPRIIMLYYLYYLPYIVVLTLPVVTLLSTVFTVGSLARHNEMVALKALGYSLYRVMAHMLFLGLCISFISFLLAEGVVAGSNRKKEDIREAYLQKDRGRSVRLTNMEIQEPPDKIITIGYYDMEKHVAHRVTIETLSGNRLISRIDASQMRWDEGSWLIEEGYSRVFRGDKEEASPLSGPLRLHFQFNPEQLVLAQSRPDEMSYRELLRFIRRVRQAGGEVHQWLTDLHIRIAFPLGNLIIVLFSVPITYNRRKRSLIIGFGVSLAVCFFYFGIVKTGQTMGQKGSVHPLLAAWMGNIIMTAGSFVNIWKTRK